MHSQTHRSRRPTGLRPLSLAARQVTFSAPADAGSSASRPTAVEPVPAAAEAAPAAVGAGRRDIDWAAVWDSVAGAVHDHVRAGRSHWVTEDVVRFATARALEDAGVAPEEVRFEHRVADISASVDLVVGDGPDAVVELKYPRDPTGFGAADTMTFGELLRDFYRLAWLDLDDAWALQVMDSRLRGYLSRRPHLD